MMRFIDELIGLVSSQIEVMRELVTLIKLETRLARLSIVPLLFNICMLLIVILTVWFSGMILLALGINLALQNFLVTAAVIFVLNLFFLFALIKYLLFNVKKMSFEKTRQFLSGTKEHKNNELQKENHPGDSGDGKALV